MQPEPALTFVFSCIIWATWAALSNPANLGNPPTLRDRAG